MQISTVQSLTKSNAAMLEKAPSKDSALFLEDQVEKPAKHERATWGTKADFYLNLIGFFVGLGNVWRFSALCFKNGGGAFLLPYLLLMLCCGMPVMFLEIAMGQYTKQSTIGAWKICPIMQGIGYASMQITFYYISIMNVLGGWCIFYLIHSFTTGRLPWSHCENFWNSQNCVAFVTPRTNATWSNGTSIVAEIWTENSTSSEEEFWNNYVLQKTEGLHELGGLTNWRMILCYTFSWLVNYLCVCKGVKSTGKVVYVTATLPLAMIIVLVVRGLTLEGAMTGIQYYLTPVPSRLLDSTVWIDAGGQVLYTLGACFIFLYSSGSYNKFNNNCYRQCYFFVAICAGCSFLIGFAVFGILGHMAHVKDTDISNVVAAGPGLVFRVIPVGISLLSHSQVWSSLFFFTLILLAIDSQFSTLEGFITTLGDFWPSYFGHKAHQKYKIACCAGIALFNLPMLCGGGIYIFQILNNYGMSGICILWVSFFQTIGMAWVYGVDNFFENIKKMIGYYPNVALKYCYKFITPLIILSIFTFYCVSYSPLRLGNYEYPWWGNFIGWIMSAGVVASVPIVAIRTLMKSKGSLKQRMKEATTSKLDESHIQKFELSVL